MVNPTQVPVDTRVITKIQKLLNMANGTAEGGEEERDTAMRMALNLLAKHNLSMSDTMVNVTKEKRETQDLETYTCPWRRSVAGSIAKMFFSNFFYSPIPGKQKNKFTFVGLESNVITAKDMTDWIIKSVTKEVLAAKKRLGEGAAFETSFLNAAAAVISRRCTELRAEAELANKPVSGGTAMVLASLYDQEAKANALFIQEEMGLKLKNKPTPLKSLHAGGTRAGAEFGKNINLGRQIGGAAPANKALK